jgi:hypothetical protein
MSDEILDPEEQSEILSSGASGVHYFRGVKLEPFSWGRCNALQRIMRDELSPLEINAAIIYLCTLPAGEVGSIRGEVERRAFLDRVEKWAEEQGVRPGGATEAALTETAERIWSEYTTAQTEPDVEGGGSSGES